VGFIVFIARNAGPGLQPGKFRRMGI